MLATLNTEVKEENPAEVGDPLPDCLKLLLSPANRVMPLEVGSPEGGCPDKVECPATVGPVAIPTPKSEGDRNLCRQRSV